MTRTRVAATLALLLPAALLWWADARAEARESHIRVDLSCHGDRCEARVDDGEPLVQEIAAGRRAKRLGFYAYHPWETADGTAFRDLRIDRPASLRGYALSLAEIDHAGWFENDDAEAWKIREGTGLVRRAEPGTRGIALLAPPTENDFDLSVVLDDPIDAGIAFRGYDDENIWLFVVRPAYNDAFFFRLHRGEPQEIQAIMPLRPLTPVREGLRIGGAIGKLIVGAAALWLGVSLLAALIGRLPWEIRPWKLDVQPGQVRVVALLLFMATVLMCASISTAWLHRVPHIEDESAYLFQARIFAAGELWAAPPEHPEFFAHEHLILQGDRWFSKYPPLFSALLALGVLAGAAWLVNPLLAGIAGWLVYRLGRELAGPVWGLIAWALLLASPFFAVMGATHMSHMLACALGAGFVLCLVRAVRTESSRLWCGAGVCLALMLLTRPFTAGLLGLAAVPFMARPWFRRPMRIALLGLGVAPGIVVFLAWGALHSEPGEFSVNPYAMNESSDTLGFGPDKGSTWLRTWGSFGHTPAKALRAAQNYLDYTSDHLFGWPLRLSFAFALLGWWLHRRRSEAWLLALIPVALAIGHGFYWATQHLAYGARYWFAAVPALVLLTVLGLRSLTELPSAGRRETMQPVLAAVVMFFVAYNLVAYMPRRLHELPQFGGVRAGIAAAVERAGVERGIVFVRTVDLMFNDGFYLNDPIDPGATLFAVDRGDANGALLRQHPDREAWQWDGERLVPMTPRAEARR